MPRRTMAISRAEVWYDGHACVVTPRMNASISARSRRVPSRFLRRISTARIAASDTMRRGMRVIVVP